MRYLITPSSSSHCRLLLLIFLLHLLLLLLLLLPSLPPPFAASSFKLPPSSTLQNAARTAVSMMQKQQSFRGSPRGSVGGSVGGTVGGTVGGSGAPRGSPRERSGHWGQVQTSVREGSFREMSDLGMHLGGGHDFPGRIVPGQKFCIFSFPGECEEDWKVITGGFVDYPHYPLLSVACVFFPDEKRDAHNGAVLEGTGSHFYGKHGLHDAAGCHCAHIYAKHASFKEWKDGKAPWGCLWFDSWMTCAKQAHALGQEAAVIYKQGARGDDFVGLGLSQLAEVNWMKAHGIPIKHRWDVKQFQHFIKATATDSVEGQSVWEEAEELAEHDSKDPHMLRLQKATGSWRNGKSPRNSNKNIGHFLDSPTAGASRRLSNMVDLIPREGEGTGWFIMMRHGESEGNVNSELYKEKPTHALELTDTGREQARGAASIIRDKFIGGHCHVYISPYARTRQTWESVKGVLLAGGGIDSDKQTAEMKERQLDEEAEEEEEVLEQVEEKLEEKLEHATEKEGKKLEKLRPVMLAAAKRKTKKGKRVTIATSQYEDDLIEQNYGNLAGVATISDAESEKKMFGRYFYRYPNGERVADVVKRTDNFMKQLRQDWEEKENVLLVTHGVTFRAILLNLCTDVPGETNVEKFDYFRNPGNCTAVAFKWPMNTFSMTDAEWFYQQAPDGRRESGDHGSAEKKSPKVTRKRRKSEVSESGTESGTESGSDSESDADESQEQTGDSDSDSSSSSSSSDDSL
jgi:broad specificity phosphatase PhoE